MLSSTITAKGQITIPKDIRNMLNVGKGDRVEFFVNTNGSVTILPVTTDITALKGLDPKPKTQKTCISRQQFPEPPETLQ